MPITSAATILVMTLNVAHGARAPLPPAFLPRRAIEQNLSDIAALVRRERPDVVALEELDRPSFWSGRIDHLARIGDGAGYPYRAFGAHREIARGPLAMRYGTALLATAPLGEPAGAAFHAWPLDDKGFVVATVRPPALGGAAIDVVSVHLDPFFEGTRRAQVRAMVKLLRARPQLEDVRPHVRPCYVHGRRPLVVMGDMNASWNGGKGAIGELARALGLRAYLSPSVGDTYSARHPWRRIDWILISDELEFVRYRTLPDVVSDHRAVVAELRAAPPR